jgi:hypothetical protein
MRALLQSALIKVSPSCGVLTVIFRGIQKLEVRNPLVG